MERRMQLARDPSHILLLSQDGSESVSAPQAGLLAALCVKIPFRLHPGNALPRNDIAQARDAVQSFSTPVSISETDS